MKLKGYPWRARADNAFHSRRLMCQILHALFDLGWIASISADVSKRRSKMDLDAIVLREQVPAPSACEWMSISFDNGEHLRFVDAPRDLIPGVLAALDTMVQRFSEHRVPGCYEVEMCGYPWHSDSMLGKSPLLGLLSALDEHGWSVYASVDQKLQTEDDGQDTGSTWHCCRSLSWGAGLPAYHA